MNSYPPELLVQLAPVMFVAGLEPLPATIPQSPATPKMQQDPFFVLSSRLRDALISQRKVAVWQPEKSKSFQVVLVDKEVRFPPRKIYPSDEQSHTAHSPLSPLTPSSPLHPDGLIAPIWVRKHTTLVPSVFVLFLRLFETPPYTPRSPLDPADPEHERQRDQEERRRDTDLSAEIAQRKKATAERSIKLTVVLMATRKMLDDPSLDSRLTYIRRQSGLDSRASLFVLSPVSASELSEFVQSLQQALWEPSIEYYTSHSKRVRRKRNRHAQSSISYSSALSPMVSPSIVRPLRPEGWTVRYEYKMACFAEFRGEDEVALKHYQDAYDTLVAMFGSAAMLPPRTKRWAEAKVLADSINIKICKLFLYNNEHTLALSHQNSHVRKFADFSRSWGIGDDTFEFWSWMARQHRILAELLDQGTRSTLTIPDHRPPPPPSSSTGAAAQSMPSVSSQRSGIEMDAMRTLGLNPSHALQHPGFYFYTAARCTEKRRQRFLAVSDDESGRAPPPGYANEKKVDHLTIVLELYTKSYELFKKYTPANTQTQSRLTLYIAYRIAQTYYESGKFDMAVRFFERIAKTYRRENWGPMLSPLLSTWYACAQQLGDVELSVRLLVEMIGHGTSFEKQDAGDIEEDLLAVMQSTTPSSVDEPLVVDLSESEPILDTSVVFWLAEASVDEEVAFQLSMTAPTNIPIGSLPFTSLAVVFTDDNVCVTVQHSDLAEPSAHSPSVQRLDVGYVRLRGMRSESKSRQVQGNLRWHPGDTLVLSGSVSSDIPITLEIVKLVLTLKEGSWWIEMPFDLRHSRRTDVPKPRWLTSLDPVRFMPIHRQECSSVTVRHRPHELRIFLRHDEPAYLNEEHPITIDITNEDYRELDVVVDVLLHPTELDNADDRIRFADEDSSSLIKGIPFGVLAPGVNVLKTLYLSSAHAAGERTLDVSVQSRCTASPIDIVGPASPDGLSSEKPDTSESLHTLVVSIVDAIKVDFEVAYRRKSGEAPGIIDLRTFDDESWDDANGGEASVTARLECVGPWGLKIESIVLLRQEQLDCQVIDTSVDEDTDVPAEWLPGDEYCSVCRLSFSVDEERNYKEDPIVGPGEYKIAWRRVLSDGEFGPISTTRFPLPPLHPPTDGLIAIIEVPSVAKLHTQMPLQLTIRNRQPVRSANITIQLEPEASDGFIVAGLRSGRIPILLPGAEETVRWQLIPLECGYIKIPKIKVTDRRKVLTNSQGAPADADTQGEFVKVVDIRWEGRNADGTEDQIYGRGSMDSTDSEIDGRTSAPTVLVLP